MGHLFQPQPEAHCRIKTQCEMYPRVGVRVGVYVHKHPNVRFT